MATEKEILSRVKNKRDTSANWTTHNPVILNGEIIIVDTAEGEVRFKIGDGVKTYTQLPFEDEAIRNLIDTKIDVIDFPVDSVNGKIGAVVLGVADIDGAASKTYVDEAIETAFANIARAEGVAF